jgi:hypothetical protein
VSRDFISGFRTEAVDKMHTKAVWPPSGGNWGADRAVFERRALRYEGRDRGQGAQLPNPGGRVLGSQQWEQQRGVRFGSHEKRNTLPALAALFPA